MLNAKHLAEPLDQLRAELAAVVRLDDGGEALAAAGVVQLACGWTDGRMGQVGWVGELGQAQCMGLLQSGLGAATSCAARRAPTSPGGYWRQPCSPPCVACPVPLTTSSTPYADLSTNGEAATRYLEWWSTMSHT